MPFILVLGRLKHVDLFEFEASLIFRASSRTAKATQRNPILKNQKHPPKIPKNKTNKQTPKQNKKNPKSKKPYSSGTMQKLNEL